MRIYYSLLGGRSQPASSAGFYECMMAVYFCSRSASFIHSYMFFKSLHTSTNVITNFPLIISHSAFINISVSLLTNILYCLLSLFAVAIHSLRQTSADFLLTSCAGSLIPLYDHSAEVITSFRLHSRAPPLLFMIYGATDPLRSGSHSRARFIGE